MIVDDWLFATDCWLLGNGLIVTAKYNGKVTT